MLAAVLNWHAVDTKTRAVRQHVSAFVALGADHVDIEAPAEELEDIPPKHDVVEDGVLRDDQHRTGCRLRLGSVIHRRITSEPGLGCSCSDPAVSPFSTGRAEARLRRSAQTLICLMLLVFLVPAKTLGARGVGSQWGSLEAAQPLLRTCMTLMISYYPPISYKVS